MDDEQREFWLPKALAYEITGAYAQTELGTTPTKSNCCRQKDAFLNAGVLSSSCCYIRFRPRIQRPRPRDNRPLRRPDGRIRAPLADADEPQMVARWTREDRQPLRPPCPTLPRRKRQRCAGIPRSSQRHRHPQDSAWDHARGHWPENRLPIHRQRVRHLRFTFIQSIHSIVDTN